MFVGAAVAGLVISTAGGVKARGALLRDVSSYLIAIAVVAIILRSGSFTWLMAVLLLAMYLLFVAAVLAADIVHIWQKKRYRLIKTHIAHKVCFFVATGFSSSSSSSLASQPSLLTSNVLKLVKVKVEVREIDVQVTQGLYTWV